MHLAKTEVQHRCTQLTELGVAPALFSKVQSIMSQKYSGDITIIPKVGYSDFLKVLSNPTNETVMESITRGERATWPSMSGTLCDGSLSLFFSPCSPQLL